MALSDDQRALLRLLRAGDSPEQVAEVLGTTPDEVRRRARDATTELEREPDPEFPQRQAIPAEQGSPWQRWPLWAAAGVVVVVALVVILVVSSGGDGGGGGDQSTGAATPDREDVVPIELSPVGGSQATGRIAVVRTSGDQPAVDLAIRGLRPSGPGETYVLWFVGSGGRSLPVAFRAVTSDGRLTGRAAIPTAASSLLPSFDIAELTLAGQRQAAGAVRRAAESDTLPQPIGTVVMRGALR